MDESIELKWQEFIDNLRKLGEKERHCFLSVDLSVSLVVWRLCKFNVFCALRFFLRLSFKAAKKANRYPGRGMRSSTSFSPSWLSCRIDRLCFAWVHFSRVTWVKGNVWRATFQDVFFCIIITVPIGCFALFFLRLEGVVFGFLRPFCVLFASRSGGSCCTFLRGKSVMLLINAWWHHVLTDRSPPWRKTVS